MPAASSPPRLAPATLAGVLLAGMAVGTVTQFILGALAPFITSDLGLSRTRFGLVSTVFFCVAAIGAPLAGPRVDRLGGRRMLTVLFGFTGLGLAGMAVSPHFVWFAVAAGIAGVAAAVVNPVTNQLVAAYLPRGRQGAVTGVKQSGVQVGAFLVGAVLPATALALGWRVTVGLVAALVLLALPVALAILPREERPVRATGVGALDPADRRFVAWLSAYAGLMGIGGSAVGVFLVLYTVEALGFRETHGGAAAALLGGTSVIARVVQGRMAERRASPVGLLAGLAAGSVVAQLLIWAAPVVGVWSLWVGVVAFGITAASWNAVGMLAIVREVASEATGRASGIVQSAFYVGLLVSPPVFGWAIDVTGGYGAGWAGVTVALGVATVLALVWRRDDVRRASRLRYGAEPSVEERSEGP